MFSNRIIRWLVTLNTLRVTYLSPVIVMIPSVGVSLFLWLVTALTVPLIVLSGCSESASVSPPIHGQLVIIELDSIWVLDSEQMHLISVQVSPPNIAVDREMICLISGGLSTTHFRLYDDGSFGRWDDSAGYADSISGDRVPNDGVFSRRIKSNFYNNPGNYFLTFALSDSPPPDSVTAEVVLRVNSPPVVISHTEPDSVPSGSAGLDFSSIILDPDGQHDVTSAELLLFRTPSPSGQYTAFPMMLINDTTWSWQSEPRLAAGLSTGSYPLAIRTADHYLSQINQWAYSDTGSIWLENLSPRVIDVEGPDTIWIPPDDTTTIFFHYIISVDDDQGFTDLDTLNLVIIRPDSSTWENQYFDDGNGLDTTALDGRFAVGFRVNNSNETDVTYTFDWTPSDRSPQRGTTFRTSLVFLSGEGFFDIIPFQDVENANRLYIHHKRPFN